MIFLLLNLIFALLLVGGALYLWRQASPKSDKEPMAFELNDYTLLSISVPKNNTAKPEAAEQFFAALHGIFRQGAKEQPRISLEIVARNRNISFRAFVPKDLKEFVTSQIYAQYPTVEIKEVSAEEDYARIPEDKKVIATELSLKRASAYPIRTFQNFEVDPLATTTGVLSSITPDEEIWIQLIVRPVDDDWQDQGRDAVKEIKEPPQKGRGFLELAASETKQLFVDFFKELFSPGSAAPGEKKDEKKDDMGGPEQQAIKAIEEKVTKLGFETNIRILAAGFDEHTARAKLEQLVGAFKQFNTLNLNGFSVKDFVTDREVIGLFQDRTFGQSEMIFNITELASLYHFPSETVATPNITWAGAKKGEPPSNLPVIGAVPADELTIFAETDFRNHITKFGIKKHDRRLHAYIIGKTGTGKSTFIENMIYDDIREGRGVAVVDPHGQLIDRVLEFIPEDRVKDVVYFNPADYNYPMGFNILELNNKENPEMKNVVASGVIGIFKKIFGESWGPRLEYILRNAILAVLEYPNSTLLSVMRVLTDNAYRRLVINEVKDPVIRSFFVDEYEKYDPKFRQEAINPIQNKVGQFLSSSIIRNIVGQPKSTMKIDEIMNNGKILLADLSTGKIGEDNSALLGSMLITKIQLAAMGRTNIPENERRDFYLYVDEFQNFATDSFATILSEARKYRLNLVMVNQYISQMPDTVKDAVFGNVGTMVAFRVGATDAESLKQEFEPVFDVNDLVNQPNRHVYIKMAIDGVTARAFSASTLPPPEETAGMTKEIVESSREQFAIPRSDVEDYIAEWSAPIDLSAVEAKKATEAKGAELPKDKGFKAEGSAPSADKVVKPEEEQPQVVQQSPEEAEPSSRQVMPPKGSKIEILKDRFARNWYAVTGADQPGAGESGPENQEARDLSVTAPIHEGVIAPETSEPIIESIAQEEGRPFEAVAQQVQNQSIAEAGSGGEDSQEDEANTQADEQGRGGGQSFDHLITWEQAEQIGITDEGEAENKPKESELTPIDEIS